MGYESRLIIGHRAQFTRDGPPQVLEVVDITLDLSKAGGSSTATGRLLDEARRGGDVVTIRGQCASDCDKCEESDCEIAEDCYGDPLTLVDRDALIAALEQDQVVDPYRRFSLALAVLREFRDNPQWDLEADLVCAQFGR